MVDQKLGFSVGDDTEVLLQEILEQLEEDELLGEINVTRELEDSDGLAGEPITIGVVVFGGVAALSAILRVVERWLEHKHQKELLKVVAEGFERSPELANELIKLMKKYADVSLSYGIAEEAWKSSDVTDSLLGNLEARE